MTLLAAALVVLVLAAAIVRPHGLPEVVVAAPAAALLVALGAVTPTQVADIARDLGPTLGFLAATLVLAHLADAYGVFRWIADRLRDGSGGRPKQLFTLGFVASAITTAVLSLDATVVLLTPSLLATARLAKVSARPASYTSVHLANSASLLMPVSNLTNLLAFSATGLAFVHFTALMTLPWLAVLAIEYLVLRRYFHRDLSAPDTPVEVSEHRPVPTPRWALTVLTLTLLGFASSGAVGLEPVWAAVAGAIALAVPALKEARTRPWKLVVAADPYFVAFVLALGIVVAPLTEGAVGQWLADALPQSTTFPALLATAAAAAVAANLVNNLPATLLLLGALGPSAPTALILAVLIGVNVGPNLTYTGSLATMLWRRIVARGHEPADLRTFTVLGVMTVPLTLLAGTAALWLVTR